ncbi:hypothetical protein ACJBUE_00340 [Ralstonia syzygii subsp. celebesensis]|uniref:hypothetical protein n=2 Tax=Ralstonia syzygii TaxID=28097 RepID=UPI0015609170|nr:hypothetical protein [Ralstonia syzygii]QQV56616.1 hypothetical protein JK151_06575 [Ralstonia syzygii subsp. celebesensis]
MARLTGPDAGVDGAREGKRKPNIFSYLLNFRGNFGEKDQHLALPAEQPITAVPLVAGEPPDTPWRHRDKATPLATRERKHRDKTREIVLVKISSQFISAASRLDRR